MSGNNCLRELDVALEQSAGGEFVGPALFACAIAAPLCDDDMAEALRGAIQAELHRRRKDLILPPVLPCMGGCPDSAARRAIEGVRAGDEDDQA